MQINADKTHTMTNSTQVFTMGIRIRDEKLGSVKSFKYQGKEGEADKGSNRWTTLKNRQAYLSKRL